MRPTKFIILLFVISTLTYSCGKEEAPISQGKIIYNISYPKPIEDKWMERLMPKEMEMFFDNGDIKTEMSFGLGMIQIAFLSKQDQQEVYEMLKFMRNKNYAIRNKDSIEDLISEIPEHVVEFLPDTQTIAGLLCKKAYVKVKDIEHPYEFECWYTDKIDIKNPNWCTPFREINGVLMQYRVERFNVMMEFKAKEVIPQVETMEEDFNIPEKYEQISIEKMQQSLEELKDI